MAPMTLWKHSQTAQVTQGTAERFTQTRGAQQGDVAGSIEASAARAEQARATRAHIHQAQADGAFPWATVWAETSFIPATSALLWRGAATKLSTSTTEGCDVATVVGRSGTDARAHCDLQIAAPALCL